jgi:hypothetical protein
MCGLIIHALLAPTFRTDASCWVLAAMRVALPESPAVLLGALLWCRLLWYVPGCLVPEGMGGEHQEPGY